MNKEKYIPSSSIIEIVGHWLLAFSFILLFLSGMGFLFSFWRPFHLLFGGSRGAAVIHHKTGILFSLSLLICFLAWIKECFPNKEDIIWLKKRRFKAGLYKIPKKGKFNTLQKTYFWGVIFFGLLAIISGHIFNNSRAFSHTFLIWNYALHTLCASFFLFSGILHIYMRIFVHPGALTGIIIGKVSRQWAKNHRTSWLEKKEKQIEDY